MAAGLPKAQIQRGVYTTQKLMQALGLKAVQAVGLVGCFIGESGCSPSAVNGKEKAGMFKGSSANGAGYGAGIAQWSNNWKTVIQKQFNCYKPIETWTLDQQIAVVIKHCNSTHKRLCNALRSATSVAQATDYALRGYENSGSDQGFMRTKQSMKAYTWAKTVWIPNIGTKTFSDGYIGLLTNRTANANIILQAMGSTDISDLSNLGSIGGYDMSIMGDSMEGAGAGISMGSVNQYPVHPEYETFNGIGGNVFEIVNKNAISQAAFTDASTANTTINFINDKEIHVRIYSTNDSKIVLDELSLPVYHNDDNYANKDIKGAKETDNTARIEKGSGDVQTTDTSTNVTTTTDSSMGVKNNK